jgi:DNA-binding transcriptional ArsR family regulator
MPIPNLGPEGFLPPGEYLCTLGEIAATFASGKSPRRQRIMAALETHLRDPFVSQFASSALVDGSFIGAKAEPEDVDVVLGLRPGSILSILTRADGLNPRAASEHLQGRWIRGEEGQHLVHAFVDDQDGQIYQHYRGYFQQSDRSGEPRVKGILVLVMPL